MCIQTCGSCFSKFYTELENAKLKEDCCLETESTNATCLSKMVPFGVPLDVSVTQGNEDLVATKTSHYSNSKTYVIHN